MFPDLRYISFTHVICNYLSFFMSVDIRLRLYIDVISEFRRLLAPKLKLLHQHSFVYICINTFDHSLYIYIYIFMYIYTFLYTKDVI